MLLIQIFFLLMDFDNIRILCLCAICVICLVCNQKITTTDFGKQKNVEMSTTAKSSWLNHHYYESNSRISNKIFFVCKKLALTHHTQLRFLSPLLSSLKILSKFNQSIFLCGKLDTKQNKKNGFPNLSSFWALVVFVLIFWFSLFFGRWKHCHPENTELFFPIQVTTIRRKKCECFCFFFQKSSKNDH